MRFCLIFRVANTTLPQVYLENLRVYGTMSVKEIIKFHQVYVENLPFLFSLAATNKSDFLPASYEGGASASNAPSDRS